MVDVVGLAPTKPRRTALLQSAGIAAPRHTSKNWWSQGDARPRFRNANAVSCYSTMAPSWCPRSVARRLPLLGRQPCISQHLSGKCGCRTVCAFGGRLVDRVSVALTSNSLPGNLASTEHDGPKMVEETGYAPAWDCLQSSCRSELATLPRVDARIGFSPM